MNTNSSPLLVTGHRITTPDMGVLIQVAPINIILCLQIITLNYFIIRYYWARKDRLIPLMYLMIGVIDIVTAVGVLLQSIVPPIHYNDHTAVSRPALRWCVGISNSLITISYRSSVFYNLLLALSRTFNILKPFYRINKTILIVFCALYPVLWIGILGYDIHKSFIIWDDFDNFIVVPILGLNLLQDALINGKRNLFNFLFCAFIGIPFLLPVLIVLICSVIQLTTVSCNPALKDPQNHVTITILAISILFVTSNATFAVFMFLYVFWPGLINTRLLVSFGLVSGTTFPIINAAFNPVILIARSKGVRAVVRKTLSKLRNLCCNKNFMPQPVAPDGSVDTLYGDTQTMEHRILHDQYLDTTF